MTYKKQFYYFIKLNLPDLGFHWNPQQSPKKGTAFEISSLVEQAAQLNFYNKFRYIIRVCTCLTLNGYPN